MSFLLLQDSWKCNFLGLVDTAEVPAHVLSTKLYVLIDIKSMDEVSFRGGNKVNSYILEIIFSISVLNHILYLYSQISIKGVFGVSYSRNLPQFKDAIDSFRACM